MKVSIIMLAYNHEKFIADAIEGVLLQQTNFPFELIVANDFSTDQTELLVDAYRKKYPVIVKGFYNEKNLGPSLNFLKAFELATGEYVALCEGDDYWTDPYKLQKQIDFLDANPSYSLCCHAFDIVDENNRVTESYSLEWEQKFPDGLDITMEIFFHKWITQTLTTVFRKKAVNFNFSDYTFLSDTVLFFNLLLSGKGFWMNFKGGCYRIHQSGTYSSIKLKERLLVSYKIYAELFRKNKNILPLRNALIEKTGQIIEYVMDDNNRKEFNFNEMCSFSIRYYRISLYKKKAAIYIYQQEIKKIILRSKIELRKTIDKKYRAEINKYRTPSK